MDHIAIPQEELLEHLFNNILMPIAYLDTDFNFVKVNNAYASADEKDIEYFLGKNHFTLYPNDENEAIFRQVVESGEAYHASAKPFEYEKNPERGITHWDWSLSPVKNNSGDIVGVLLLLINVTKHVETEIALHQEHQFVNNIMEAAGDIIVVLDKAGKIIKFNHAAEKLTKYSFDEVKNKYVWDFLLIPEEVESVKKIFQKVLSCDLSKHENHWVAKTGERYLIRWNNSVMKDSEGDFKYSVSIGADITEERQQLLSAEADKKRFDKILSNSPSITYTCSPSDNFPVSYISSNIKTYLGYTVEECYEEPGWWEKNIHPDEKEHIFSGLSTLFEKGTYHHEYRFRKKSGDYIWVSDDIKVIYDKNNQPIELLGSMLDISERKKNEFLLQHQATIINQIHDSVISTDLDGIIQSWNRGAERLFGFTETEMLGKHISSVYPEDEYDTLLNKVILPLQEKGNHDFEPVMMRKSGEKFIAHLSLSLLYDEHGQPDGMIGYAMDISDRKKIERELEEYQADLENLVDERTKELLYAKEDAEHANQLKSSFLSRMSHELRTPMNAIIGFSQLLKMEEISNLGQEFVDEITFASEHLLSLINEVLDLATIEAGKIHIELKPSSLYEISLESISVVKQLAKDNDISLMNEITSENDVALYTDPVRLKEILVNFLTNAIKYNKDDGSVILSCSRIDKKFAKIVVADTGIGIANENQFDLFEPFNRLGAEYTNVAGTGIGLSIAKQLSNLLGGKIGVESKLDIGSKFWVEIPLSEYCLLKNDIPSKTDVVTLENKNFKVLYIEDNPANLRLVQHFFKKYKSIELLSAINAEDGFKIACQSSIDLILLDINLPGIDGYEALKMFQMNEKTKDISVLAVSAAAGPRDIEKGLLAGFKRYITKPINLSDFMEVITSELSIDNRPER